MKKNNYYINNYQRRNLIKDFIYNMFLELSSWPRLLIEVFLRRNMGERYFSLFSVGIVTLLLWGIPFVWSGFYRALWGVIVDNIVWYLFSFAFLYFSFKRRREIVSITAMQDLGRFSLSNGLALSYFYERQLSSKLICTVIEPGIVFILGSFLALLGQKLGLLLTVCSVFYSLSHLAAYARGNDYLLDKIDEAICNKDLMETFMNEKDPRELNGFEFVGDRPKSRQARERVAETFWSDTDDEVPEVR